MEEKVKGKILTHLLNTVDNIMKYSQNLNGFIKKYVQNMDGWVKDINKKISVAEDVHRIASQNLDNVQHNYELIYELKDEVEELKQEIQALKLIQIISLKKVKKRRRIA